MELFSKLKEKIGSFSKILLIVVLAVIIAVVIFFVKSSEQTEVVTYDYNMIEQQIADEVKAYLALYLTMPDETAAKIADAAVQNYNIVIVSNVDIVSDDHTDAIKQRIRLAMVSLLDDATAAALTDDNLDALSSGIASIIWNTILSQLEETTIESGYKEEYLYLSESIQNQIDELEKRKMKVSIQANINSPDATSVDAESLLTAVNAMTDEELQELARAMGLSFEELQELLSFSGENLKEGIEKDLEKELAEGIEKDLEKELADLKKELTKEITKQIQTNGNNTNSSNGRDGRDGNSGKDGQNGTDGKTTYIAYADDLSGAGFSLMPTESSKYVGTCITTETSQPRDFTAYSNWQIYRTYIITTTVDENNITTVHIN